MFCVGDYVVKPNTGICQVADIVVMNMAGTGEKEYYLLHPVKDKRSVLYVSVDVDRARLRLAMNAEEAEKFIKNMPAIKGAWIENDKMREQKYKEAFRTNEAEELVSIIKNMYSRSQKRIAAGKKVTATDDKYFQQAENLLCSELGFALGKDKEEVSVCIRKILDEAE